MTITCPSCSTKFSVDENLVKSPFQKMKCSRCHHIFVHEVEPVFLERPGEQVRTGKRRRGTTIFLVILLLLVGAAAAAYYLYWENFLGASSANLRILRPEGQELVLKDGRIFLVNGSILNGSTKPRKFLLLKSKVFDKDGNSVAEKHGLAGLLLTKEDLQGLQGQEVLKRLNDFKLAPVATFQSDRNKELPFAVVFSEGDFSKVKTFSVEIIDSPSL